MLAFFFGGGGGCGGERYIKGDVQVTNTLPTARAPNQTAK